MARPVQVGQGSGGNGTLKGLQDHIKMAQDLGSTGRIT
jgi:hypothetical protein